jgi:predicted type IV restriction endonuclease
MTSNLTGTVSLDKGKRALDRLLARLSQRSIDWNEAETRFQFIDPFLTNCLGWPKSLIHVERASGREYTDYELGEPRVVIWEAKREGIYFELPANPSQKLICSLPSIMATSSKAAEAIKQVQIYCSTRGVQFAVVCNGQQLIAFLAVRLDGQNPLDGECLVCDGYLRIKSEFPTLWQTLSPEGITERRSIGKSNGLFH